MQQLQPTQPSAQQPQPQAQQDVGTNRPKRYSSLRQRPAIAEGPPNPTQSNYQPAPPAPQHSYYPPPQGIFSLQFNTILLHQQYFRGGVHLPGTHNFMLFFFCK